MQWFRAIRLTGIRFKLTCLKIPVLILPQYQLAPHCTVGWQFARNAQQGHTKLFYVFFYNSLSYNLKLSVISRVRPSEASVWISRWLLFIVSFDVLSVGIGVLFQFSGHDHTGLGFTLMILF